MSDQEAIKTVMNAANRLAEHFDSVQILVTRMSEGNTRFIHRGVGNWYARRGMAHAFIQEGISEDAAEKIAEKLKPEE